LIIFEFERRLRFSFCWLALRFVKLFIIWTLKSLTGQYESNIISINLSKLWGIKSVVHRWKAMCLV
jgi:hypothetical protein